LGQRKVLVLRTAFLNAPTTTATASLFPTMVSELVASVNRMSSGRTTLQVRYDSSCIYVVDYTLAQANDYNNNNLQFLASAKAKAEAHPIAACRISADEWATFHHYMTALPASNLPFAGVAAMPGNNLLLNGDQGMWIGTALHELGHNFGLPHANRVDVVAQSDMYEYGNPYDVMGSNEGQMVFQAGYQDVMGWMSNNNRVSYPIDAYASDVSAPPIVATYTLPPIHAANGELLETVRIPTVAATRGHYDNWIYLSWTNHASTWLARGVLITEDSLSLYTDGSSSGATGDRSFLRDISPGTLSLRDGMINATTPYVYGVGGGAPVLIEVTANQATASGMPIRVTRLGPSGERIEGRGCTLAAGCEKRIDDVPVLQCGSTITLASRRGVVRLESSVRQAAVVSVAISTCANSELGVFRVVPVGQIAYGSPPRVSSDDATNNGCLGIEVPVGPDEPIWVAVASSSSSTDTVTLTLTCGSTVASTRRRIRFTDNGAGLSGIYELYGAKAWLNNEHIANSERRLTYDTTTRPPQWRGDVYPLYQDESRYGFLSIVPDQSESPVQWNGRALTNDRTVRIQVQHACPRSMYAPAENQCAACPSFMTTDRAGAVALSECKCLPGFAKDANGACQPCPAGTYSTSGTSCTACPNNGISPPQSPLMSYCKMGNAPDGYCPRLRIANMATTWYGNDLDGIYEWDKTYNSGYPTFRQTSGGKRACVTGWFHRTIFTECATGAWLSPVSIWTGNQAPMQEQSPLNFFTIDSITQRFNSDDSGLLFNQPGNPPLSITCEPEPEAEPEWRDPPASLVLSSSSGAAADIPMGTYTLFGTNYTAPVYSSSSRAMYLAWHGPSRTWGFTQTPALDATDRWAITDPMPGRLTMGASQTMRVFDSSARSFSLAISVMINTASVTTASPSSPPQTSSPTTSSQPSSSRSPGQSATRTPVLSSSSPTSSASPTPLVSSSQSPSSSPSQPQATRSPSRSVVPPSPSSIPSSSATQAPPSPSATSSPTRTSSSAQPSSTRSPSTRSPSPSSTTSPTTSSTRAPPTRSPTTSPTSSPSHGGGSGVGASGADEGGGGVSPIVGAAVAVPVALVVAVAAAAAVLLAWKYHRRLRGPHPLRRRTSEINCPSSLSAASTPFYDTSITTSQHINDMYSPDVSGFRS
jgi:hypothetical protein